MYGWHFEVDIFFLDFSALGDVVFGGVAFGCLCGFDSDGGEGELCLALLFLHLKIE